MKYVSIPCPLCRRASTESIAVENQKSSNSFNQSLKSLFYTKRCCPTCGISFSSSKIAPLISIFQSVPNAEKRALEQDIPPIRSRAMDENYDCRKAEITIAQLEPGASSHSRRVEKNSPSGFAINLSSRALGLQFSFSIDGNALKDTIAPIIKKTIDEVQQLCVLLKKMSKDESYSQSVGQSIKEPEKLDNKINNPDLDESIEYIDR